MHKVIQNYCIIKIFVISLYYKIRDKDMTTGNFRAAVDEVRENGGTRQTMYIKETWKDREMTIFGYADGTAEVFESTRPYMVFNSVAEAIFTLNKMQEDYNKSVEESNSRWSSNNVKIDYCSVADWYDRAPRGTYFGD